MSFRLPDFISGAVDPDLQAALQSIHAFPEHLAQCLLCGPPRSGKTSILLQYAFKAASNGQRVIMLCQRDKMEQSCPTLPQGVDKANPIWQKVQLRYFSTSQDLQKYASCLHIAPVPPNVIIVDDISNFMQSRLSPCNQPCLLLISDASSMEGPRSLYIFERWCPLILTIQSSEGKQTLSALPALAERHLLHPSCFCHLHFSLTTHAALTLEGISWS